MKNNFKVGDKVYDDVNFPRKKGRVISGFGTLLDRFYPIRVKFKGNHNAIGYTNSGLYAMYDVSPSLRYASKFKVGHRVYDIKRFPHTTGEIVRFVGRSGIIVRFGTQYRTYPNGGKKRLELSFYQGEGKVYKVESGPIPDKISKSGYLLTKAMESEKKSEIKRVKYSGKGKDCDGGRPALYGIDRLVQGWNAVERELDEDDYLCQLQSAIGPVPYHARPEPVLCDPKATEVKAKTVADYMKDIGVTGNKTRVNNLKHFLRQWWPNFTSEERSEVLNEIIPKTPTK